MDSKKIEEGLKHEVQILKQQNEKLIELLTKCKVVLQLLKSRTHALVKENKSLLKLLELKTKELKDYQATAVLMSSNYCDLATSTTCCLKLEENYLKSGPVNCYKKTILIL
ncbi:uncharacterized protein LOC143233939 isoform X1 [Tachypleus tridentatus]|uniref:uncharacterized protein LOC143233939 isoform X1 n=1 Tax=Tachypleus tridentatus TaxID=6853 RepID=UPI003FD04424